MEEIMIKYEGLWGKSWLCRVTKTDLELIFSGKLEEQIDEYVKWANTVLDLMRAGF